MKACISQTHPELLCGHTAQIHRCNSTALYLPSPRCETRDYPLCIRVPDPAEAPPHAPSRPHPSSLCFHHGVFSSFDLVFSAAGRWNAIGMALAARNSTTLPWTPVALVLRLTLPCGRSPLPPTRSPSRPRAAPRSCGGRTRTRTWRPSPCSDGRERSASRCDVGGQMALRLGGRGAFTRTHDLTNSIKHLFRVFLSEGAKRGLAC